MKLSKRRKFFTLFLLLGSVPLLFAVGFGYHLGLLKEFGFASSGENARLVEMPTPAVLAVDTRGLHGLGLAIAVPSNFRDESAGEFTSFSNDQLFVTIQVDATEVAREIFADAHEATGKKYTSCPAFRRDCYSAMFSSVDLFASGPKAHSDLYLKNMAKLSGMLEVTRAEYFAGVDSEGLLELHKDGTLTYYWQLRGSDKSGVIHFRSVGGDFPDMDLVRTISRSVSAQ